VVRPEGPENRGIEVPTAERSSKVVRTMSHLLGWRVPNQHLTPVCLFGRKP
jgi:hypothetical protein